MNDVRCFSVLKYVALSVASMDKSIEYYIYSRSVAIGHTAQCFLGGAKPSFPETYFVIIVIIVQLAPIQCIAPLAASNLQSGLSSARLVVSSMLKLCSTAPENYCLSNLTK